ncbi:NADP-dependent oxidoreductase domain-containing protein [Rhexocercosporidium sp. MPI-PUGE-AT-0058]|nr:NADP-dependent oxidoreductase domain-containing protein [Rhexocercosporidium sp. MPI-PUGE-AT-0058]
MASPNPPNPASATPVAVALSIGTSSWDSTPSSIAFQDAIIPLMRTHAITRLDTARIYGQGASETAIGKQNLAAEFTITTKAPGGIPGSGEADSIIAAARASFDALKVDKVHIYLLHGPDESVSISETYSAIQTLYNEGRFQKFGLSNFSPSQVDAFHAHAKTHSLILPTIYQSTYSAALRLNETLLFPTLRELGMSIQAYSPLAMGFLAKSSTAFAESSQLDQSGAEGKDGLGARWDAKTPIGRVHRLVFEKPEYIAMLQEWEKLSVESGVCQVGLAYRWVKYHSFLDGEKGDEMILGASSKVQFVEAIAEIERGPLERWVVKRIEGLWEGVKEVAEVDNLRAFKLAMGEGSK